MDEYLLCFLDASWEIVGDDGAIHGPHSTAEMHEWLLDGFLDQLIWAELI